MRKSVVLLLGKDVIKGLKMSIDFDADRLSSWLLGLNAVILAELPQSGHYRLSLSDGLKKAWGEFHN